MNHNVLRIRVVSIEGEVVRDRLGSAGCRVGYDLLALMIGSEGMLGVVTEVTVKLVPKPELAQVVMASFADVAHAPAMPSAAIIAAGIIPAGLEMMDKAATAAVEPFQGFGYDMNAEAILLCESDGTPRRSRRGNRPRHRGAQRRRRHATSASRNPKPSACASGPGARRRFPAVGRITPDYYCMDGTIPRKRLAEMLSLPSPPWRTANTACAAPTSSTPATAICTH